MSFLCDSRERYTTLFMLFALSPNKYERFYYAKRCVFFSPAKWERKGKRTLSRLNKFLWSEREAKIITCQMWGIDSSSCHCSIFFFFPGRYSFKIQTLSVLWTLTVVFYLLQLGIPAFRILFCLELRGFDLFCSRPDFSGFPEFNNPHGVFFPSFNSLSVFHNWLIKNVKRLRCRTVCIYAPMLFILQIVPWRFIWKLLCSSSK